MNKFKVGDKVLVENKIEEGYGSLTWLINHQEGIFEVRAVDQTTGSVKFKEVPLWYDEAWCALVTDSFDIEKVDISWFTDRVEVGEQVARDDKISLLLREVSRGARLELTQIRSTSFICGTHWKYAVAERHFDLFVKWIALQEDIFNQRHLLLTLKQRNEEMQATQDKLDKQNKWYNNIPEEGVVCWVSDDVREPDSGCGSAVVTSKEGISTYTFYTAGECWLYATPLTEQEIIDTFLSD